MTKKNTSASIRLGVRDILTGAKDAASRGAELEALRALLEAWRGTRAPEIADALGRRTAAVTPSREPIGGKPKELFARWCERLEHDDPRDVGVLLATLRDGTVKEVGEKIDRLAPLAPDPRIAAAIAEWIEKPPFTSTGSGPTWTKAFALLLSSADRRAIERIRAVVIGGHHGAIGARLAERIPGLVAKLEAELRVAERSLGEEEITILASIPEATVAAPSKDARTIESLLADVYADPRADGPRLVVADALQEKGDPRGELIALQFATRDREPTKQERARLNALLKDWRALLGPLGDFVAKGGLVFERGFPVAGELHARRSNTFDDEVRDHPAWSTFERIVGPVSLAMVRHAREIHRPLRPLLDEMLRGEGVFPAEFMALHLWSVGDRVDTAAIEGLRDSRAFPSLRRLRLVIGHRGYRQSNELPIPFDVYAPIFDGALGRSLTTFEAAISDGDELATFVSGFARRRDLALETIVLHEGDVMGAFVFTLERAEGRIRTLRIARGDAHRVRRWVADADGSGTRHPQTDLDYLEEVLSVVDPKDVGEVIVERFFAAGSARRENRMLDLAGADERARLRAVLARFTRAELLL